LVEYTSIKNNALQKFLSEKWGNDWSYEGGIMNNLPNGFGKLKSPNNEYEFQGEFKNGFLNGLGKKFQNSFLIEEGYYIDNILNGLGIEYQYSPTKTSEGNIINKIKKQKEGNFIDGVLNGFGTKYLVSSDEIYEQGEFENDLLHGIGKRNLMFLPKFEEGLFINGVFQGK
jgi:hypothetical protein